MTERAKFLKGKIRRIWLLLFFIIALALCLRIWSLDADLPWDLSWSQGVMTDGPWYVEAALSKIRALPNTLRKSFDRPFLTYYAYWNFRVFGISFSSMNFISVIPGILSILFLGLLFHPSRDPKGLLISTSLLSINYFYVFYNRTPMIYSLLSFFCIFCVWLWQLGFKKKTFFYLSYILILFAAIHLKFLIIFLIPILFIWQILSQFKDQKKQSLRKIFRSPLFLLTTFAFIFLTAWFFGERTGPIIEKILRNKMD